MTTDFHPAAAAVVVAVTGAIDFDSFESLETRLLNLVDQGGIHLVLDLSGVSFCDSVGMNTLLRAQRHARERQGSLILADIAHPVANVMAITGVDTVIRHYPTTAEALRSLPA